MKMTKKLLSTLLCMALLLALCLPAFAEDANVTYDGKAREFIFAPGSEYSPTDLFPNFKNVMPGDELTQQIQVKNDASKKVKVKIYLRSLGAEPDSGEFLSKLNLTVTQDGTSKLFDAPANQTAGLTEWICLGTFYSGADVLLNVTLHVPAELGNEILGEIGYLDWKFKVEEYPIESTDPNTGDSSNESIYWILFGTAALLAVGLLFVLVLRRKKRENEA